MTKVLTASFLLASAVGLAAQAPTFTSPAGFATTEGATNHDYILASKIGLTFQQLDGTNRGNARVVKSIAWRRDGTGATNSAYTARTMEMEVVMADTTVAYVSTTHANNYKNPPSVVFTKKMVNAPDWTTPPATPPSPWNLKLVYDTPWVYLGVDDFLWELRVTQNSAVTGTTGLAYGFDFDYIGQAGATFSTTATGVANGTGCLSTGMTAAYKLSGSLYTHPNRLRLALSATGAPATTPVSVFLDGVDSNLSITGLCGVLHAVPTATFDLGTSTATGSVATKTFDNLPYNSSYTGVVLHMQAVSIDAGQSGYPVTVSNGLKFTIAAPPTNLGTIARVYSYLSGATTTVPSQWTGGLITQFEY